MEKYIASMKIIDGFKIPSIYEEDKFLSAIKYQPQTNDIFIVSYPKSGTNWTQYIVHLIWNKGEPCKNFEEFQNTAVFIDKNGADNVARLSNPKVIKTHITKMKISSNAKYLYIARNPKDVSVSYYHHLCHRVGCQIEFDEFFEHFYKGDIPYGDYFLHIKEWYERRNDPNVLFMTYEEMKEDQKNAILKMTQFLFGDLEIHFRRHPEIIDNIIKYSSVEECRKIIQIEKFIDATKETAESKMKEDDMDTKKSSKFSFVRKGIVGDWKNYLSKEQSQRLDKKAEEMLLETEIYEYWKKLGIFQTE